MNYAKSFVIACTCLMALNVYATDKKEKEVLTLSGGKYVEVFDQDSIEQIGSILYNVNTEKIVGFVKPEDNTDDKPVLKPEIMSRWLSPDPHAAKYPNASPYCFVENNPIIRIDPDGRDWYTVDGAMKFDPKVKSAKDLKDGQTYVGNVYNEKTKRGTANYREDGSIMYSNETDAYNRMWSASQQPGGGTNTHEVFGAITKKGVLVLPDYKNNSTTSEVEEYGYKFVNGNLYDPISKNTVGLLGTIHTHQLKLDNGPSASPSIQDLSKFSRVTPNKPFMTMGWDGKVHGAVGDKTGTSFIQLPKGYSTVRDILGGASLIQLLNQNKR